MVDKMKTRLVLPVVAEFLRFVTETLQLDTRAGQETETTMAPIVTRAKSLVSRRGLILAYIRTED